jgi:hypothetical protein
VSGGNGNVADIAGFSSQKGGRPSSPTAGIHWFCARIKTWKEERKMQIIALIGPRKRSGVVHLSETNPDPDGLVKEDVYHRMRIIRRLESWSLG